MLPDPHGPARRDGLRATLRCVASGSPVYVSAITAALVLAQASGSDPQRNATARPLVVIDAGHSIEEPGARSARGVGEHDFNVAVAERVRSRIALRRRADVEVIGVGERAIGPRERARLASSRHAALLVSIHHDAAHPEDRLPADGGRTSYSVVARGFSVHARGDSPRSVALAQILAARMRSHGFTPSAYHASRHPPIDLALGIYRRDHLALLNSSTVPTVILECGFISDREEERELADPATRERIADAVAEAVEEALGPAGSAEASPRRGDR